MFCWRLSKKAERSIPGQRQIEVIVAFSKRLSLFQSSCRFFKAVVAFTKRLSLFFKAGSWLKGA
jgi:hypothetical protein